MKRYDLELTATGPVMEESKEGAFVPFSEVSGLAGTVMKMADRCKLLTDLLREARNPLITAMEASSEDESTAIEELIDRIDALLAGQVLEPIYYMRDNHTFKRLSDDVDTAITEIEVELDAGWTSGMLCSKRKGFSSLHANSRRPREEFISDCRDAMLAAAPKPEGGEPCAIEPPLSSKA